MQFNVVFDINMEDFKKKAKLLARGHMTEALATITYGSIMCRETVRVALMIVILNDLGVKKGDILNIYVQAPSTEKVWTVLGPELGKDARKTAVIVRTLNDLKSAGTAFRSHFA